MKDIKAKVLFAVAILFLALACCGCGDTQNTKNYGTIAADFTEALYSEDFDTCLSYIDEFYRQDINEDALLEMASGTTRQFGAYQHIDAGQEVAKEDYLKMMGNPDSDLDIYVYYQPVSMSNGDFAFFFLFNPSTRMICGISVCTETEMMGAMAPGNENDNDNDSPEAE